jgi:disulfide oxidoreductase YuzD
MTKEELVIVKILDLPGGGGCGCSCGSLSSRPEYTFLMEQKIEELKAALEAKYPGETSVNYVNLRESPEEMQTPAGRLLAGREYPAPLVLINGKTKFAGSVVVKKIIQEVENILGPK